MEWRAVPGWAHYEVSDEGLIRNLRRGGVAKRGRCDSDGYCAILLCDGRRQKWTSVHRLVLLAFVGPPPKGHHARHLNDFPTDNRLSNLAWGTPSENAADRVRNGHLKAAVALPADWQDAVLKSVESTGYLSLGAIACDLGVSRPALRNQFAANVALRERVRGLLLAAVDKRLCRQWLPAAAANGSPG